jgi:hypothetical protein
LIFLETPDNDLEIRFEYLIFLGFYRILTICPSQYRIPPIAHQHKMPKNKNKLPTAVCDEPQDTRLAIKNIKPIIPSTTWANTPNVPRKKSLIYVRLLSF